MLRLLLSAPLAALAVPAIAQDAPAPGPIAVSTALSKGCKVHQVHTPAGKMVHNAPIVKCEAAQTNLADKQPTESRKLVMK